jgi:hypothetical protein
MIKALLFGGYSEHALGDNQMGNQPPRRFDSAVVIASGEPWRFSAFFMKVSAAFLSRVLVMKLSRISPS